MRQLIQILAQHNHAYYVMDQPTIADSEYDQLFHQLIALEQQYPECIQADTPTNKVGDKALTKFESVTHVVPMLSLGNVFNQEEDMLLIARRYAGYSIGEADVLRKTIGRKELDKFDGVVHEFIHRCDVIGRPHDVSVRLGEILKACGRYLFSKNHSYAYATVTNTTSWLAMYYPKEYFCSTLNSLIDDHDKSVVYIAELKRLKIPVLPPEDRKSVV